MRHTLWVTLKPWLTGIRHIYICNKNKNKERKSPQAEGF